MLYDDSRRFRYDVLTPEEMRALLGSGDVTVTLSVE